MLSLYMIEELAIVKIVLFLKDCLKEFLLPSQIFGTFCFDESEDNDAKLINIEGKENEWYLISTTNVKVFNNGNYVFEQKIVVNNFYSLERDGVKYLIYVENIYDNGIKKFKYNNKLNLIVGNDNGCNINYENEYIKGIACNIKYSEENIILERINNDVIYLNKKSLDTNRVIIMPGDIIELYGLKIVILRNIILVNNPLNKVFINKLTSNLEDLIVSNSTKLYDGELKEFNLYNDNQYFSKSPRIRRTIKTKTIKIDAPPQVKEEEDIPLIYTLGPMLTMGMTSAVSLANTLVRISSGETTFKQSWSTIAIAIAMLSTTLLWPAITKNFNKKQKEKKRKENIAKYRKYLEEKKKEIAQEAKLQRDILIENLISNDNCLEIINGRKINLWTRRVEQDDFLTTRIGIGNYPLDLEINCPEDGFSIDDTTLKKEAMGIAKEYEVLENVPIGYSFLDKTMTAVMGSEYKVNKFMENVILQLVTFHSYEDLKIVLLTNEKNKDIWKYIKYLPHNFDNNKQFRFFAANIEEAKEVSNYLEQVVNSRRYDGEMNEVERSYTQCQPYYLIITDNYSKVRKTGIMKILTEINNNYGFSLVILENRLGKLPSKLNNFISIGDKTSGILEDAYENQKNITFVDEINYNLDMYGIGKVLSNIPIEFENGNKMLPNTITFLEMENIGKVEQLNVINRWKNNDPTKSLKAEIGVDENGDLMYLDLHEKAHGPHGLIAGMTGSGKSEFIITYVLSMAVNYSPNEVSFILIDYKGGGLAGAFENKNIGIKLPHLAGTITNLDKAEMDRTLVSIDSEVRRRQKVFNEARDQLAESTIDIYKYQRFYREGKLKEPVPHLIIICDEFAELKSQQPDFMDNLISIARIGRSLGVHLILATQKPSGVVDDQIWSNSKFRVCLKVQEKADSMEMLKRPEAAELKQVGRYYLQVGYNEMFALGQSAWCGAKYFPSDKVKKNIDKSINFINNIGVAIKNIQGSIGKKNAPQGEELAAILKYIISAAKMEQISSKRLWLDNIPPVIYVDNLVTKYNIEFKNNIIEAIIGEYDDPSNQNQGILKVNLNTDGNTLIFSSDGSDKELLLESIIYSTTTRHKSEEINYYIIDYGSEALRIFNDFPHVGDMVFFGEDEKLNNLIKIIKDIISDRKKKFSSYGGEYNNYIKNSGETMPLIGIIINNYDAFTENNANLEEELISLCRDGQRYGIFFVITANSDGSVRRKIKQNFNTIFALKLNDISDYNAIFNKIPSVPKDNLGRGIFKKDAVYEFQTASITDKDENNYVKNVGNKLKEINSYIARRIPTLPDMVGLNYVSKYIKNITNIPIGVEKQSLEIATYDFTSYLTTFILSTTSNNLINFSKALLTELTMLNNLQLIVVDLNKEIPEIKARIKYYYDDNSTNIANLLIDYIKRLKENTINVRTVIYFQNFNKFKMKLDNSLLEEFTKEIKNTENVSLLIADDYKKLKKSEFDTWYRNIQNDTDGIWIGTGLSDQNLFKLSRITKEMGYNYKNNFGFTIKDGRAELIKTIELSNSETGDKDE